MGFQTFFSSTVLTILASLFWLTTLTWAFYSIARGDTILSMVEGLYPALPLLGAAVGGVTARYILNDKQTLDPLPCFAGFLLGSVIVTAFLVIDTHAADSVLLSVTPFRFATDHLPFILASPIATFVGVLAFFPVLQWVL